METCLILPILSVDLSSFLNTAIVAIFRRKGREQRFVMLSLSLIAFQARLIQLHRDYSVCNAPIEITTLGLLMCLFNISMISAVAAAAIYKHKNLFT